MTCVSVPERGNNPQTRGVKIEGSQFYATHQTQAADECAGVVGVHVVPHISQIQLKPNRKMVISMKGGGSFPGANLFATIWHVD